MTTITTTSIVHVCSLGLSEMIVLIINFDDGMMHFLIVANVHLKTINEEQKQIKALPAASI